MKKGTRITLFVIVIIILALSYFDIISKTTALVLFSLGLLLYLSSFAQKIDGVFDELGINLKEKDIRKIMPISYKLDISVGVDWGGVIRECFPDLKDNQSTWDFVRNLYQDEKLDMDKDSSLYQQPISFFDFTMFRDGLSGLEQVWSRHHNAFVDELLVRGRVFDGSRQSLETKFKDNPISRDIFINPNFIAFEHILPDGHRMPDSSPEENDKISKIPFWEVFYEIQRFHRSKKGTDETLELPDKLKKEMQKLGVSFDMDYSFHEKGYIYSLKGKLHEVDFRVNFFGA